MSERLEWRELDPDGTTLWADMPGGCAARVVRVRGNFGRATHYEWAALEWTESFDGGHYSTIDSGTSASLEWAKRKAREMAQGAR